MFYLVESPVGMAIFKGDAENYTLIDKHPFQNTQQCSEIISNMNDGNIPSILREFIMKNCPPSSTLNILNPNITDTLETVRIVCEPNEVFRKIRNNVFKYFGISKDKYNETTLRMAQSMVDSNSSVDTILTDVLSSIEELETAINNRIMRIREWYSIHFPELNSVSDHTEYLKMLLEIGNRSTADLNSNVSDNIKYLVANSMGTDFNEDDIKKIKEDALDILSDVEFKNQQMTFLKSATRRAFPNMYNLIGDVLTVKLVRKAGSISQLAQKPSSTIQIYGSEKAYNEAIKNKGNTPKYGYIYYSDIVSNSSEDMKGKAARFLSNKIALCARVDSDPNSKSNGDFGMEVRKKLIKQIEASEDRIKTSNKPIINKKKRVISVKDYNVSRDDSKKLKKTE